MPSIPQYQQQVEAQALPGVRQQSIASPSTFAKPDYASAAGQGLSNLGDVVGKHAEDLQIKQDTATGTQMGASLLTQITDYKIEARKRQGDLAKGLPEEADKFYNDIAQKAIDAAPNDRVKQYLTTFAAQQQPGFHGYIGAHAAEQLDKAQDAGFEAHNAALVNGAAVDPATADANLKDLAASVKAQLIKKGITDPEQIQNAILAKSTDLHAGVINTLLVHNPTAAIAYFGTHKDGMTGEMQAKIEGHLKVTIDANESMAGADKVWQELGPKADGQPARLDKMEQKVRDMFPGDAGKIKDTIAEVRSRVTAFNSSELERTATNTNKVMDAYAKGASLAQLKAMPEYFNLPGDKKAAIQDHVEAKIWQQQSHIDAVNARNDAKQARAERAQEKAGFGAYLAYSNPDVLARLTENQIQAMIPYIGTEKTGSLMNMKRALNNPQKIIEAKMDTDDFNQIANNMGLKPFGTKLNEDEKAALGGLRFRIEHLIQTQQDAAKRPLTRAEKNDIMRNETARSATVDGGWFSSDKQIPVIQMKPEQVDKVIIPAADRKIAATRLQTLHDRFPQDPRFVPNEHNLRMIHLQSISNAADFIDGN